MQRYLLAIAFLGCWMSTPIPLAAFQNEIQLVKTLQDSGQGAIASLSVRSDAEWKFFCKVAKLDENQKAFAKELDRRWMIRNLQKVAPEMLLGADAAKQAAVPGASTQVSLPTRWDSLLYFQNAILQTFESELTAEQVQRYKAEMKARKEFQEEANLEGILFALERNIPLTRSQREAARNELIRSGGARMDPLSILLQPNFVPPLSNAFLVENFDQQQIEHYQSLIQVIPSERGLRR